MINFVDVTMQVMMMNFAVDEDLCCCFFRALLITKSSAVD
jgi:hypothetical protein